MAAVDLWMKNIASSTALRKWFNHDPNKWNEFMRCYCRDLKENKEQILLLVEQSKLGTVTLLYGAKDEEHNEAIVLRNYLAVNN